SQPRRIALVSLSQRPSCAPAEKPSALALGARALQLSKVADGRLVAPRVAAATSASAAATAVGAASTATAAAAAARALFARTRFIDGQGTALQVFAVEDFDRLLGFGVARHGDEGETAGFSGEPVLHQDDFGDRAGFGERILQVH